MNLTHAIYLLIIGVLLGGYFVGILTSPAAHTRLRQDLTLLAEVLLKPLHAAVPAQAAPVAGWRANVTGRRSYRGRHHLPVPYPQYADLSWTPAHLHAMGVLP